MFKNVIIFVCGAGAGAAASYFIFKEKFKSDAEKAAQEEIDKFKEEIKLREKAADKRVSEVETQKEKEFEEELKINLPEVPIFSALEKGDVKKAYKEVINYSKYSAESKDEIEDDDEEVYDDLNGPIPGPSEGLRERPYIISEKDYLNTLNYHSKEALLWYEEDGMLTDEEDIPVEDMRNLVGEDFIDEFEENPKKDRVFVRNERAASDYEIVRIKE